MVEAAKNSMQNRCRYSYSLLDFMYNLAVPFECCQKRCRKNVSSIHARYLLFNKGDDMYIKELDVVEFVKAQHKLKMMVHSLMDESERFLAPYQKLNVISLDSDADASESDDPAFSRIPKLLSSNRDKQDHKQIVEQFFVRMPVCVY